MRGAVLLLAVLALVLGLAPGILKLEVDNAPEHFFPQGDPALRHYARTQALFARGDALRILVEGRLVREEAGIAWLRTLEERLRSVPGVREVAEPAGPRETRARAGRPGPAAPLPNARFDEPLAGNAGWASADGEAATVTVILEPESDRAVDAVESLLREAPDGLTVSLWGLPVLDRSFDRGVRETLERLLPLSIGAVVLVLWLAGGSLASVLPPLLLVSAAELAALGAFGFVHGSMNMVTSLLPSLLMVIGASTTVHIQTQFRRRLRSGEPPRTAAEGAARERGWAVLWGGATTAAAFGSLVGSPVEPVATLGAWAALGIGLTTVGARYALPMLLGSCRWGTPERPTALEVQASRAGGVLAGWAIEHRRTVLAGFALATLACLAWVGNARVYSDLAAYLPATDPARQALARFEARNVGSAAVDLILEPPPGETDSFLDPEALARLTDLTRSLREQPGVTGAMGAGDLFTAGIGEVMVGEPRSREAYWLALALLQSDPGASRALARFVSPEVARVAVTVPFRGIPNGLEQLAGIEAIARGAGFPDPVVTGPYVLVLRGQASLLRTLFVSLSITSLFVAAAWLVALGAGRQALAALAPNLWPVLFVLALVSMAALPFDAPTIMTASVILGLAVDDTFHSFGYLRRASSKPHLVDAFRHFSAGHVVSSLTLIAGFAVIGLSEMAPVAVFAHLMIAGVAAALVADLVLLPALLGGERRYHGG